MDQNLDLRQFVRDVPDFPKMGILFRDISPLLQNPEAFEETLEQIAVQWSGKVDAIAALEARGFIFGAPLAKMLRRPFIPIRKKGKLPGATLSQTYELEYGTDTIEIHADALMPGSRTLVVDDLLATGGTARGAGQLIAQAGAQIAGYAFVVELSGLCGREKLGPVPIQSLVVY